MKIFPTFFAAVLGFPFFLFAEAREVPDVPTRAEADSIIAAEMQARQMRKADHKTALESVHAYEEWEADHGDRKTIVRRVTPPSPVPQTRGESQTTKLQSEITPPEGVAWSEEEIAARGADPRMPRTLNLTAVVFDTEGDGTGHTLSKITWRDETAREWTILSNIDFSYLGGIGHFEDEDHYWMTFLFVDEVNTRQEMETARLAAEKGIEFTPRTFDPLLASVSSDFYDTEVPEYIVFSDREAKVPPALYEELDALHQYYHTNEEFLIAQYKRLKVLNEARRAWRKANPPEAGDTVINFWRVR